MSDVPQLPKSASRRWYRILGLLIKLSIVALLFVVLYWFDYLSPEKILGAHPGFLLGGFLLLWCTPLLTFARWQVVLRGMSVRVRHGEVMGLTFVGQLFNNLVPLGPIGGDLVKGAYLKRRHPDVQLPVVVSSILADRFLGLFALTLFSLTSITIALVLWRDAPPIVRRMMVAGLVMFACLFVGVGSIFIGPFRRWLLRHRWLQGEGLRSQIRQGIVAIEVVNRPRVMIPAVLISLLSHLLSISSCWFFARALGMDASLVEIYGVVPIGQMANVIPGIPQGWGAFELVLGNLLPPDGAAVALFWHLGWSSTGLLGIVPLLVMKFAKQKETRP